MNPRTPKGWEPQSHAVDHAGRPPREFPPIVVVLKNPPKALGLNLISASGAPGDFAVLAGRRSVRLMWESLRLRASAEHLFSVWNDTEL